jgi:hypothetical protein
MSLVTPRTGPSPDTNTMMYADQISGLIAGEDLLACAPCYVKAADGKIYQSNGTAANEAATFFGFSAKAYKAGMAVTLFGAGTRIGYADPGTLTVGAKYFVAATAGRLDTAATTGGTVAVARAITDTDIQVIANFA